MIKVFIFKEKFLICKKVKFRNGTAWKLIGGINGPMNNCLLNPLLLDLTDVLYFYVYVSSLPVKMKIISIDEVVKFFKSMLGITLNEYIINKLESLLLMEQLKVKI